MEEKKKPAGYRPKRKGYTGEDIDMLRENKRADKGETSSYAYRDSYDAA